MSDGGMPRVTFESTPAMGVYQGMLTACEGVMRQSVRRGAAGWCGTDVLEFLYRQFGVETAAQYDELLGRLGMDGAQLVCVSGLYH